MGAAAVGRLPVPPPASPMTILALRDHGNLAAAAVTLAGVTLLAARARRAAIDQLYAGVAPRLTRRGSVV